MPDRPCLTLQTPCGLLNPALAAERRWRRRLTSLPVRVRRSTVRPPLMEEVEEDEARYRTAEGRPRFCARVRRRLLPEAERRVRGARHARGRRPRDRRLAGHVRGGEDPA